MNYIGLHITCNPEAREILIAEFSLLPFDTFQETEAGFQAYCEEDEFDSEDVEDIITKYRPVFEIGLSTKNIPSTNWNELWEKNFDPVNINTVYIRAPFHEKKEAQFEIVISPKMSFGTGHHETTHLMIRTMLTLDFEGKKVLDLGTGTGILAILAYKLGASEIQATDIDDWSIQNCRENIDINGAQVEILKTEVSGLPGSVRTDIILANINKNVLLSELQDYGSLLTKSGLLLLSGFYVKDNEDLLSSAGEHGLVLVNRDELNGWSILVLRKSSL